MRLRADSCFSALHFGVPLLRFVSVVSCLIPSPSVYPSIGRNSPTRHSRHLFLLCCFHSSIYLIHPTVPTSLPSSLPTSLPTSISTSVPTSLPTSFPTSLHASLNVAI